MHLNLASASRTSAQSALWFWILFAGEVLLSGMVLAGILSNHLWSVAFQQAIRTLVVFAAAFTLRRIARSGELSPNASNIVLWAGTAILLVGTLDSALLIQYDVALGHLSK